MTTESEPQGRARIAGRSLMGVAGPQCAALAPAAAGAEQVRLEMTGIAKRFGAVRAIRSADMTVNVGRVLALVGENGAGKSTLIKVLSGAEIADTGSIAYEGPAGVHHLHIGRHGSWDRHRLPGTTAVQRADSVGEHLHRAGRSAGRDGSTGPRRPARWWSSRSAGASARYSTAVVGDLSIAEQQQVSIAKALAGDAKILILDEPSAILTDAEIEVLFSVVRRLTGAGVSVIYISHRLDELFRIAQEVTVMRDGRTLGTYPVEELSVRKVVELMVGGILTETKHERATDTDASSAARAEVTGPAR